MTEKGNKRTPLGARIKQLRQERGWSQAQFAKKLEVHPKQVSGYERGAHAPSTDVMIRMAEILGVSLDYLVFENRTDSKHGNIADLELIEMLEKIDRLSEQDKKTVKAVLDTFILKSRFQELAVG
jgi:transcriptional regulator with XRE-family HTH domain